MLAIQCAVCGKSVTIDEQLGSGQPCPACGQPIGALPIEERVASTSLDNLNDGVQPVRFGAYSKAADAAWDDPTAPVAEAQVASLVKDEAIIDNAVINAVPPEIEAKFRARRRETQKKLIGIGVAVVVVVVVLVAFILY